MIIPASPPRIPDFAHSSIRGCISYYETAGVFNVTGETHRPLTRAAQILSIATSLTWILFIAGVLGGSWSVLVLFYSNLTPEALIERARAELCREFPDMKTHVCGAGNI